MKPFPILKTNRLVLRELRAEDRTCVLSLYVNPEVTRYCDMITLAEPAQAAEIIRLLQADWEKDAGARWAVTQHGSPELVGICGVGWHRHNCSALLSYDLNRRFWGQGIMTEAVRAVIEYAFGQAWVNRITAITVLDNPASVKVLLKAGFQEEGVLRDWGFWKGTFRDVRCLSLLRRDIEAAIGAEVVDARLGLRIPVPPGVAFAAATVPARLRGCQDTPIAFAPPASRGSSAVAAHPQG